MNVKNDVMLIPDYIVRDKRLGVYRNIVYIYMYMNTNKDGMFRYDISSFAKFLNVKSTRKTNIINSKIFQEAFGVLKYHISRYEPIYISQDDIDNFNIVRHYDFNESMKFATLYVVLDDEIDTFYKFAKVNALYIEKEVRDLCKNKELNYVELLNSICFDSIGINLDKQDISVGKYKRISNIIDTLKEKNTK